MMESINVLIPFAPTLFGVLLGVGGVYMVASLLLGGFADAGFDVGGDVDADFDVDVGDSDTDLDTSGGDDAVGLSLNVIAAFCVGTGAMGLVASLNDWSVLLTILTSLLFGLLLGRAFQVTLSYVFRQQGGDVTSSASLVGMTARVTVDTPAGKLGEALIEEPARMKYAVQHLQDEPLEKGDMVRVVEVVNGRLHVRKIQS